MEFIFPEGGGGASSSSLFFSSSSDSLEVWIVL